MPLLMMIKEMLKTVKISCLFVIAIVVLVSVCNGEGAAIDDLSNNIHSKDRHVPGYFRHRHLTGSWNGRRDSLEDRGLCLEMIFTGDILTNHTGGLNTGTDYLGNIDLAATLDTEKAGLWKGGSFSIYLLNNHGATPSEFTIGDLQTVSNIETKDATRLYELWYEHLFDLNGTDLSMLIGQHDLNSEFNVTEYGSLFTHSSFGIQADISVNVPVSIFSVAAPAFRIRWEPADSLYLMAAVYDGDPGAPDVNRSGMRWRLSSDEGFMYIYEMGYHFGDPEDSRTFPGSYKLGYWQHTAEFADVRDTDEDGNPLEHFKNYGVYFLFDQMLLPSEGAGGLGVFFQVGGVPDDRNEVDFYMGGGIHYRGLIPSRENDILGLGAAHASISGDLRDVEARDSHETAVELTYRAEVFPWLAIQPGVQVVFNPGADPTLDNAVVTLFRFQIYF